MLVARFKQLKKVGSHITAVESRLPSHTDNKRTRQGLAPTPAHLDSPISATAPALTPSPYHIRVDARQGGVEH
ncbi:hypothetical protein CCM_08062 [Cordyceps militaris CM01]|uniref:Uncharacterized protein n=2 Tax=Cordyceps militaris TaxID=73501 RepID=G3JPJ9_CORMM|nr:uncharacterized protein CCM_08062 [Cordyceps militaris CM01]ATY62881.1 hypothetical protein A9K55_006968 [Cordyceps militaris]EGX89809.1 hypothetical protein CCM_08062 [Cordyceps militaris CM01]